MNDSVYIKQAEANFFDFFYSIKSEKTNIHWSGHLKKPIKNKLKLWFVEQLKSEYRKIFEVISERKRVGYLYIDKKNKKAEISYAIKEEKVGKGIGTSAVKSAIQYIENNDYYGYKITAYVAKKNIASIKILENNFFRPTGFFSSYYFESDARDIDMLEYVYKYNQCLIIAEAGVNHNGSIETARALIDAASDAGADAVKFQTWKTELLVSKGVKQADYQLENTGIEETQFEMLKKLELSYDDFNELKKYCDRKKILFMSTPDETESADFLFSLQSIFKIGSGELTNVPFLRHIGAYKKNIILSTGMATLGEIEKAVSILVDAGTEIKNITVLHATTMYPTEMQDVNLNAMITIEKALKVNVGYSDHTMGFEVPVAAVAMGAKVIEKHFTLSRDMVGPDHSASLEPEELKNMVKAVRNVEVALGNGLKAPRKCELDNRRIVRKAIVAKKNIKKGDLLSEDNMTTKRQGKGISSSLWDEVIGLASSYDIGIDEEVRL